MGLTAPEITTALRNYFSMRGGTSSFTMKNVYLLGSPWESDVIRVMKSQCWHELEIKLSVADFRADFRKKITSWNPNSPGKHAIYSTESVSKRIGLVSQTGWRGIPIPASFTFVTPAGLLSPDQIPSHCGLMEVHPDGHRFGVKTVVKPPRLKAPTKISYKQLFNLCQKK